MNAKHLHGKMFVAAALLLALLVPGPLATAARPTPSYLMPGRPDVTSPAQTKARTTASPQDIQIVLETEPSIYSALDRLEVGELDVYASGISRPDLIKQVQDSPNLDGYRTYGSYNELTFNPAGPVFSGTGKLNPFAVPRVREAMNWLIDREHLTQEILGGGALPRWLPINTVSLDYAELADVARGLELYYAHDKDLAQQIIAQEMLALGATLEGNLWHYNGEPVEIIAAIRTEDARRDIGDYVSDLLEDIGFTVMRNYGTGGELGGWFGADPEAGEFHFYTGGWVTTVLPRNLADNFAFFYTPDGIPVSPLWQAYTPTDEFYQLATDLANRKYQTPEERREMMARGLELALEDSVRLWLVDWVSITPRRAEVSYAADLYGGIQGSSLWAQTLQRDISCDTPIAIGVPALLSEPWNPIAGSNWIYDTMLFRAMQHGAVVPDPFTGLMLPMRLAEAEVFVREGLPANQTLDWVSLEFEAEIPVPDDAWVDWDPEEQVFVTAGEKYAETEMVNSKVVMYYEDDFFDEVTWHDGSPYTIADFVMFMIMQFDRAYGESPIYDETYVPTFESFIETFRGWRIVSEAPFVLEYYTNAYELDAENNVTNFKAANPVAYGTGAEAPWHTVALGWKAEAAEEAAFSSSKAGQVGVQWMNYVSGPTLDILKAQLDEASVANFVPYAPTLGQYITDTEVTDRLDNLLQWYDERGHFWIGTGPFYLEHLSADPGELTLRSHPGYPDPPDRWDGYTDPAIPDVSVQGPETFGRGEEAVYTVEILVDEEPYPDVDIEAVRYLVQDSRNRVQFSGDATPVTKTEGSLSGVRTTATTDGLWRVTLDGDVTRRLPPGPSRLEIAVTSKRIATPSFASQSFTAPDMEIYLPLVLRQP